MAAQGAYRHWLTMKEPTTGPNVHYDPIDYQDDIYYYSAPKQKKRRRASTRSIRSCSKTYEKLGIPLREQKRLAGVAVDAVFDSVSVATTFKEELAEGRRDLLLDLGGGARASRAGAQVPRLGRAGTPTTSSPR
jgi:Fe-S cluster assembly scaffold protein SufB